MPDQTDELRKLLKSAKEQERREATDFERQAKRFYIAQQKSIVSWGTERHSEVFGVPEKEKSADFVVSNGPHSLIVAEAKGSDIDHALEQLKNLAGHVHQKQPLLAIEFHILLREGTDPNNLAPAKNQEPRYRARDTGVTVHRKTKYVLTSATDEPVRIALSPHEPGSRVFVIIGPRASG